MATTPIDVNKLGEALSDYPQPEATTIFNGFKFGFSLHYSGLRTRVESSNLQSAKKLPEVVKQKIEKEISLGRVAGPFPNPPLDKFRVSPIGLVPKKSVASDTEIHEQYRLIHHLSHPEGNSVNEFIDPALCSVEYTSFDEAIYMVQDLGRGCLLGKSDIKSAFRLLPVNPTDFDLLGFKFEGQYYFDKCLPFGCAISCKTFEKFATFLEQDVRHHSVNGRIIHYLDDYFMGGKGDTGECLEMMNAFRERLGHFGVPIAEDKTEGPKTLICFLGLEIDSEEMVVRIPMQKVQEIIERIGIILGREKVTLRMMQSLIGSLNFACRAIVPGRPFCRRLIDAICGLTRPHHHLRVKAEIRQDLIMWLEFFANFNGVSVFHDRFWLTNEDVQLFTDSAGGAELGCGIVFGNSWAAAPWPNEWHQQNITADITVLELFPLLVSLYIWGDKLRNKRILFRCDNIAVVHIINSMTAKSVMVMVLLRAFTLKCLALNVLVKAAHISGVNNQLTDALSRSNFQRFHELAPEADREPQQIPHHLWSIFDKEHKRS